MFRTQIAVQNRGIDIGNIMVHAALFSIVWLSHNPGIYSTVVSVFRLHSPECIEHSWVGLLVPWSKNIIAFGVIMVPKDVWLFLKCPLLFSRVSRGVCAWSGFFICWTHWSHWCFFRRRPMFKYGFCNRLIKFRELSGNYDSTLFKLMLNSLLYSPTSSVR